MPLNVPVTTPINQTVTMAGRWPAVLEKVAEQRAGEAERGGHRRSISPVMTINVSGSAMRAMEPMLSPAKNVGTVGNSGTRPSRTERLR